MPNRDRSGRAQLTDGQGNDKWHLLAVIVWKRLIGRLGVVFFADLEAAFANVARATRPGAHLVWMLWQRRSATNGLVPFGEHWHRQPRLQRLRD